MKCHQRRIREQMMAADPRPVQESLDGCEVVPITRDEAASVILTYEWLGTMPNTPLAYYGLVCNGELLGVACFGLGMGTASRDLCGVENRGLAVCLERGACVHWSHPHAPSYLVSRACKQAARDHGWRIFYGYSDSEAGELGTIYQACNWVYIGQGQGRGGGRTWRYQYTSPDGELYSSRRQRALCQREGLSIPELLAKGWTRARHYDKSRYVHFEGDRRERKLLRRALRYEALPYPKRKQTR